MRADWFLPVLRASKPDVPERPRGFLARVAQRILPAAVFSDRSTKRRGWFRQLLRRLGPVWLAAPVRRIVQSICFLAFLWLFFVTCWPYSATPSRSWNGWIPAEFDFDSNSVLLVSEEGTDSDAAFVIGQRVFLRDDSAGLTGDPLTAPFEIILAPDGELRLERTSNIQHPTSNIQHPTSNIQHPTSNIQHPTSNIQHSTSKAT
jgi:hypothetical protein